jgi:two-component system, NtrC family, nitrogen regulation sensor histidine kinase NtrY
VKATGGSGVKDVKAPVRQGTFERLIRLRRQRRLQLFVTFGLVIMGPVLAAVTFLVLGPLDQTASALSLRLILLADMVYVLSLAALVMSRIARMIAARRAHSAGSRLHLRLTGVFALIALVPTVLVAIFAGLTINVGLEGWFSDRVRTVLGTSLSAAEAYQQEHRDGLIADTTVLSRWLAAAKADEQFISDGDLRQLLEVGQQEIQRGLREAFIINGAGKIMARGNRSYLFDFEEPNGEQIDSAAGGGIEIIEDWDHNEFRALTRIDGFADRYLYVSRSVDGSILNLLDDTQETVGLYTQLENQRGRIVFEFALLYLAFAVMLILAAIWLGLWFAERLARPVGRLAGAAQAVGAGNLDVQVPEEEGEDEIAMLGRLFNQMTRQLKGQRNALVQNAAAIEERRRLFDSVLSSVTAGVIGLDASGRTTFINPSAERLLKLNMAPEEIAQGPALGVLVPEFASLLKRLQDEALVNAQEEIKVTRAGKMENLLVRMATRRSKDGSLDGYVVAFDDVTDLVAAQRMAAWGDVARRIAHEIKNPLTPIKLSAERLRRKFRVAAGDDVESLDQMTDVIIRQTDDLRRIVDEFSRFARMPEPELREHDLSELVKGAVVLQQAGGLVIKADLPPAAVMAECDATMIGQALTNLIKNAGEAVESLEEKGFPPNYPGGEIRISMTRDHAMTEIRISDNGVGLPEDRSRLFEPYVTTRAKGTGLGLPIVKKIVEEHGGSLILTDAEPFYDGSAHFGAMAVLRLPILATERAAPTQEAAE